MHIYLFIQWQIRIECVRPMFTTGQGLLVITCAIVCHKMKRTQNILSYRNNHKIVETKTTYMPHNTHNIYDRAISWLWPDTIIGDGVKLCSLSSLLSQLMRTSKCVLHVSRHNRRTKELRVFVFTTNDSLDRFMVLKATFNNISVISWRSVLLVEKTGIPG